MTLEEIKGSSVEETAKWMVSLGACPIESGEESGCIVDDDGDITCQDCWIMHLSGIDREPEPEDPKETGRGYRV